MADLDPADPTGLPPSTPPSTPPSAVPPPAPRRRGRWLRRIAVLLVLVVVGLVVLIAAAPTLLSTAPVVHFALGKVNDRLNGRVAVKSLSLGWTSGVRIDGLQVYDAADALIAQADHVTCPMPLWKAATGSYPIGHTVVDGLAFDAKYDAQGRLNFAQLAKGSPPSSAEPRPAAASSPGQPSKLPDVSGDVELTNSRGTVAQPGKPTVFLTKLAATVKVPNVNEPIADHLDATVHVGEGGPEGHVVADGTVAAVKANRVDMDAANVHQTADVTGLDLAAAKPFVPASAGVDTLAGLVDAHLSADVTDGKAAVVDAALTGRQKVVVGGKVLHGDTYSTDTFAAAVPKLSAAFPDGLGHWQTGRIKVGADGGDPISFKVDQGQLSLLLDVVPQAVLNLADTKAPKPPGSTGRVEFKSNFDVGRLVAQLKNTAHLSDDAALTGGTLGQTLTLAIAPDKATVAATTDLAGVTGTKGGQPVTIRPVHLAVAATDVGAGSLLESLRDLSLKLDSKFANGDFHGTTVGDLTGTLTAQLQAMQAELGQLVDFKGTTLAGDLVVRVDDSGQLMAAPYQAKVKVDVRVTDLRYGNKDGPVVAEPLVHVNVTGDLQGSATSAVEQAKNLVVSVNAGTADAPTVDLAVSAPLLTLADRSADFQLTRLAVNLPQLQRQFANVPAGKAGTLCTAGTLTGTSAGHYGTEGLRLDPTHLSLAHLSLDRQLPDNQRVHAVADDTLDVVVAGTVALGDVKTVKLAALLVADTAKILNVSKGKGDLTVVQSKDAITGGGQLAVMAELGSLNDILAVLQRTTVAVETPAGRIRSGHLSGTVSIAAAAGGKTTVDGTFDIPNLDVASATGGTGPQKAAIVVRGSSADGVATADEVSFKAPFASVAVNNAAVLVAAKNTVDQLQKATLAVDVPDLRTAMALLQSFSPPKPTPPAAVDKAGKAAPAPTPPLVFTAGSLSVRADVSHDGGNLVLNVPTLTANNVAFTRGTQSYAAKPVTAKLAASVGTGDGKTVMAQLRGLKVTQLSADAGVATVTMTTPITVADLSNPAAAAGGLKVDGELADLGKLAAAFAAKPADAYPYAGHLTMTQNLAGDANAVALQGDVQIAKFRVLQGQQVQFAEDQLSVTNDVSMPADMNAVGIKALSVDMKSSQALSVSIANGRVDDLAGQRRLNLFATAKYDLAKLWPILHPMLLTPGQPDSYADVKVAGVFTRTFDVHGSYPAGVPFAQAVKPLQLDGGLAVESFEHSGLTVRNLDVPVTVRNGLAVTTDSKGQTAPPAVANDGQLDLGHVTVDLTKEPIRVSMPANKPLLTHATINPLFTKTFLNDYINNPLFVGTKDATGVLDVTVVRCDRFPASNPSDPKAAATDGTLTVKLSLTDLHIGGPGVGKVIGLLTKDSGQPDSFAANVKDATVTLAGGVATEDVTFQTGKYSLPFTGDVMLSSKVLRNFSVGLPGATIASRLTKDPNVLNRMPAIVAVPLNGTLMSPVPDIGGAAQRLMSNPNTLADIIGGQLNKKKDAAGDGNNGGAAPQNNDPASILGGLLGGNKNKGKKK